MRSTPKLSAALAALAIAGATAAPAAHARPIAPPSVAATCDPSAVPPPPSSIAASAAKDYAILRACHGRDHRAAVVASSVTRERSAPTAFDWASAAIGAVAAAGLWLMLVFTLGMRRRTVRHTATA